MTKYDDKNKCIKCNENNHIIIKSSENGYISECETKCQVCEYEDYWAYGFYLSRSEPFLED